MANESANFTSQFTGLPVLDRNDPDYTRKVSELAKSLAMGGRPNADAAVGKPTEPDKPRVAPSYHKTLFSEPEPDVDLPGDVNSDVSMAGAPGGKRLLKFVDDIGDDHEMEIELSDEKLTEIAKRARRAENLELEIAALRDEMAGKMTAAQTEMEKAKRYIELEKIGSREAILDELFKADGGYEGLRGKIIEEYKGYEQMTESERAEYDIKRSQAESARKLSELEKRLAEKEKSAKTAEANAALASKRALLNTVFTKYKFDNAGNDPAINKINEMIFNEAQSHIRTLESQSVVITENILNREFKRAHQLFRGKVNVGGKTEKADPATELANQADRAMAAAQSMTPTSASSGAENEPETLARWLKMIKEGQGLTVSREASKSTRAMGLYTKLANMISRDRGILTRK